MPVALRLEDVERVLNKRGKARGPFPGFGRGPGVPWAGIVEETPALWITWITDACKRIGRPIPPEVYINGQPVRLAWAQLTFGRRYYFVCPHCGQRREALYFLDQGRIFGCRKCLRLGYRSQTMRPTSPWRVLDEIFSRGSLPRRYTPDERILEDVVFELRAAIREHIETLLARVTFPEE